MKAITSFTTISILLLGLTSCNSITQTSPTNPSPDASQSTAQTQSTVKLGGSSATAPAMKLLAEAYQAKTKTTKVEIVSTTQSGGAIPALKSRLIDIAGTSRPPKPEDLDQNQYRNLAKDMLTVATHKSVTGVTNLTTDQLKAIYRGDITNWKELGGPDAAIVVLDRPEDESAKKLLRKYYLGTDKTTPKAILLKNESELVQTLQDTPSAIGAFSLAYSLIKKLPVNRLSLNGAKPTMENFANNQYPMVRQLGLVWNKTPSTTTQGFIDFVFSSEGSKVLQDNGFVPELATK